MPGRQIWPAPVGDAATQLHVLETGGTSFAYVTVLLVLQSFANVIMLSQTGMMFEGYKQIVSLYNDMMSGAADKGKLWTP